ncbi:PREDICTED: uncharacterized protein LOC108663611 [Theobroma cacao]|uniref:Uncharacterized protein LOC108663611 n=1 Tax=Theobroma cacao TaxID=3641 RepID=A0AB32X2D7_THECC|nr:PREDICTED: uncharacterized protein LOC108663611 [Theobroma cacao]
MHLSDMRKDVNGSKLQKPLEFEYGDYVFLKILPTKGVKRFEKKRKLSLRYIKLFEVQRRVGAIAYHFALLLNLSDVHLIFHISMLRKFDPDPLHLIQYNDVQLQNRLGYEEQPVAILD